MNKKPGKQSSHKLADLSTLWKASKTAESGDEKSIQESSGVDVKPETSARILAKTMQSWKKGGGDVKVSKVTPRPGGHQHLSRIGHNSYRDHTNRPGKPMPLMPGKLSIPDKSFVHPSLKPHVISDELREVKKAKQLPAPPSKSLRDKLREASADIHAIKIGGGMSLYINHPAEGPVVENEKGNRAILGLDFGTAFTKAVINWAGNHHAVDWSNAVEGEDPYLLASVFSEHDDGVCVLGSCERAKWRTHDGIKLKILSSKELAPSTDLVDAVIFLGLAFRYANQWLREVRSLGNEPIRWRLHVGLPTQSWDDSDTTESFKRIAQAARLLAISAGSITRQAAMQAIENSHIVDRPAVDVFPEFACQLYSYLRSPERQDDLHALVDIGAGTVDVAFFNVFVHNYETLLPVFAADVQNLGAHYLIAALAGAKGAGHKWDDSDSSLSDEKIAIITSETKADVSCRRTLFLSNVADVFNEARKRAKNSYGTSPAFTRDSAVRLFLCGGGSRIQSIRQRFEMIVKDSEKRVGVKFQVSDLVRPKNIVGKFGANFDRLSVAYGLSQAGGNIGNVMRSADLTPLHFQERSQTQDRDDDR